MADKRQVQDIQRQLIEMTTAFCQAHINHEYERLCQKLIDKMARKRTVPFLSRRPEIWAAVVYAIGSINFLFDKTFQPYASADSLCDYFKVSKGTVAQKSKLIREMFKLGYYDPEFSTEHMNQNNPLARMELVNGFLVIRDP